MNRLLLCVLFFTVSIFVAADDFPAPPKAHVISVSSKAQVLGMTMSIRKFESPNTPQSVIEFYQSLWGEAAVTDMPPWQMVGRSRGGQFYNVQVQSWNGRGSTGYLSVSDAPEKLEDGELGPTSFGRFPRMGGSELLDRQRHQDLLNSSETYVFKNNFSVQGNSQYYLNHYQNLGWNVRQDTKDATPYVRVILLRKGSEQLNLTIRNLDRGTEIVANKTEGKVLND